MPPNFLSPHTHGIGGIVNHKGFLSSVCTGSSVIQGWPLWHTNYFIPAGDSRTL